LATLPKKKKKKKKRALKKDEKIIKTGEASCLPDDTRCAMTERLREQGRSTATCTYAS
jgi:hypothetical protein